MSSPMTGGCLCGNIRYSVSQPLDKIIACHCTHCQKASGTGASHNAAVPTAAVTFNIATADGTATVADGDYVTNPLTLHAGGAASTDSSIQRGIDYLVRTQNTDGSWTEHETTGTGFPKVFYLKYDMYRNTWPLLALATYRSLLRQAAHKDTPPSLTATPAPAGTRALRVVV